MPQLCILIIDQFISALTNFLFVAFLARNLAADEFGAAMLAVTFGLVAIQAARALLAEPLLIDSSPPSSSLKSAAILVAMCLALVGLPLSIAVAYATDHGATVLLLSSAAIPPLVVQDIQRYHCFRTGHSATALASDSIWLAAGAVLALLASLFELPASVLFIVWPAGALVAAVLCSHSKTAGLDLRMGLAYVRHSATSGKKYLLDWAIGVLGTQAPLTAVAVVGSISTVGAIRACHILFGPLGVVFGGSYPYLIGRMRSPGEERPSPSPMIIRLAAASSVAFAALTLLWCLTLSVVPTSLGQQLLGKNWEPVKSLLWLAFVGYVGGAMAAGAIIALRAQGEQSIVLRLRAYFLPVSILISGCGLLAPNKAEGSILAWGASQTAMAGLLWWGLYRSRRQSPTHQREWRRGPLAPDRETKHLPPLIDYWNVRKRGEKICSKPHSQRQQPPDQPHRRWLGRLLQLRR